MRRYEIVFVLAPGLTEDEVEQQIETFSGVAKDSGAKVLDTDNWGKRRLAYPIQKHTEAYYIVMTLEQEDGSAIAKLERRLKVADPVIRFLSVRVDLELKRVEKLEKKKAQKKSGKRTETAKAAKAEEEKEEKKTSKKAEPPAEPEEEAEKPAATVEKE